MLHVTFDQVFRARDLSPFDRFKEDYHETCGGCVPTQTFADLLSLSLNRNTGRFQPKRLCMLATKCSRMNALF